VDGAVFPAGEIFFNISVFEENVVGYFFTLDGYVVDCVLNETFAVEFSESGVHVLTVEVYDRAGNSESVSIVFEVDAEAPYIDVVCPENNSWVRRGFGVNITFVVYDDHLYNVSMFVNGSRIYYYEGYGASCRYSTVTVFDVDGVYVVDVVAWDGAGNGVCLRFLVLVDGLSPQIFVSSPENGTTYGPVVSVCVEVFEDNLGAFYILVDGSRYNVSDFDIALGDGDHVLYVYVEDLAGNFAESVVYFVVDATSLLLLIP